MVAVEEMMSGTHPMEPHGHKQQAVLDGLVETSTLQLFSTTKCG